MPTSFPLVVIANKFMQEILQAAGLVAALVFITAGCKTPSVTNSPEIVRMPVMHSENQFTELAIALPKRTTSGTMEVRVEGEVHSPGLVKLPQGSTVLEAINAVGGFTTFANPYKGMELLQGSERKRLVLKERRQRFQTGRFTSWVRRCVWYVPSVWNQEQQRWEIESSSDNSDLILKTGDRIQVPRSGQ